MPEPKPGKRYLSATGTPVLVLEVQDDALLLQSLASDNRLCVPKDYPLNRFDPKKAVWELRPGPYAPYAKPHRSRPAPKPLAPIIDALLLEGERTMKGLVREVKRRASAACRGKDVAANVRARICRFRRGGGDVRLEVRSHIRVTKRDVGLAEV